ncbi:hypothetical protein AMAG_08694 [Allomyces macrogynus ATCC 38327]|uniref:Uncharacterized protein n=1 Tax=Allomyces macrogynus (strain ATCC 38327) TaxID=578462 RepID=A0A0L0SM93_ALLM3|nr:hypothetical protein AMAG_08694 [Allomyces macrogynus ATCC 38327]|eukprot:KNE63588.1 hypothetical protein AMAG_08694 [Allomyces macrogynus ATCC 38327]
MGDGNKNSGKTGNGKKNKDSRCNLTATVTTTVTVAAGGAAAPTEAPTVPTGGSSNVQTFKDALFGKLAPPVNIAGDARQFQVIVGGKLNSNFVQAGVALGRSARTGCQRAG